MVQAGGTNPASVDHGHHHFGACAAPIHHHIPLPQVHYGSHDLVSQYADRRITPDPSLWSPMLLGVGDPRAVAVSNILEQVLGAGLDDFPTVLLAELVAEIPVLFAAFHQVDTRYPQMSVVLNPEDFDYPAELRDRSGQLQGEHPISRHVRATGNGAAMRISDLMSQAEYHDMEFYRDVYAHLGVEYQLAFLLPGPKTIRIGITLSRSDRDFTDEERDLCELLRSPIAAIHANATREALLSETVRHHVASDPSAALIACDGEQLLALDDRATFLVARLHRQDTPAGRAFAAWLDEARAGSVMLEDPLPDRHHTTWSDDLGCLEIRHIPGRDGNDLLVVHDLSPDPTSALRAIGLRPREADVLELVMTGCDNRKIADRLAITQATVKKHLENIYRTLGVSTRTAAAAAGFQAIGKIHTVDNYEV